MMKTYSIYKTFLALSLVATSFAFSPSAANAQCTAEVAKLSAQEEAIKNEFSSKITVIIGAPGSGKGTMAALIKERYGVPSFSTGAALREEVAKGSEAGLKAKPYMEKGQLVPLDVLMGVVKANLAKPEYQKGFIFDGIPRRSDDAAALEAMLKSMGRKIDIVFELVVPQEELIRRIKKRGETSGRADDKEEVVPERLKVFEQDTRPVINHFKEQGLVESIDGMKGVDNTLSQMTDAVMKRKSLKFKVRQFFRDVTESFSGPVFP